MSRPVVRPSARVVVLDPDGRMLLFGARLAGPGGPPGAVLFWYPPGGGVEDGEPLRATAVRELAEEIGLVVDAQRLEGPVWLRRHLSAWGERTLDNRETYFVLRDVVHEVDVSGQTELEAFADQPYRWWTAEEIAASGETFVPRELGAVLPPLLEGPWTGPPRIVV
ncbi:NUDIX domain-containing protein [Blastococcus sp. CCUG 61487]|uniref:NUDIX hydrolase n=1 Tax=Blastococcus sp. CCUG 61487 TaxID=1840703 RepID=UPI0010C1180E|nr:NUDIX domain-containing protein [Blastococcus sp. CCUG 61487]TKJ33244.1 NUDIX hydrolase [Blastococcus sp. CCUG 61487]